MAVPYSRREFLAAAGLASIAGCLGGPGGFTGDPNAGSTDEPAISGDAAGDAAPGDTSVATSVPSAGPPTADWTLPLPMPGDELRQQARSGGPPKDGIPSIDEPKFTDAAAADSRLDDGAIVFGVSRSDIAKAYPQNVLVWHEVCNDVIGGDPVSVTYCPLTGTAQGFARGETTFGVSGRLLNNNLIMYDRASENWWPQVLSTAIPGPWNSNLAGNSLAEFRVIWTTWGQWKAAHPDTKVLSTDTGHARNYGQDPYGQYNPKGGYYSSSSTLFPRLNKNDRFEPKLVVMGVRTADGAASVPKEILRNKGLVEGAIGGTPLFWVYDDALDTGYAYWNPDGLTYTFKQEAVEGPDGTHAPDSLPLDRALTFDAMWFAWSGFYPDGSVHE